MEWRTDRQTVTNGTALNAVQRNLLGMEACKSHTTGTNHLRARVREQLYVVGLEGGRVGWNICQKMQLPQELCNFSRMPSPCAIERSG